MKPPKNPDAVKLGQLGGRARAKTLTAKRRQEIAVLAAKARWGDPKSKKLKKKLKLNKPQ